VALACGVEVGSPGRLALPLPIGRTGAGGSGHEVPFACQSARAFPNRRKVAAKTLLDKASLHMKQSDSKKPMVIEVPPARIPEEPGAVIPHAGICEGGVGKPTSLP